MSGRSPRRGPHRRGPIITPAPERPRKRSLEVPLLWLGAAAFIGIPMLRDATSDSMLRNRYVDLPSCACDYSAAQCQYDDGGWVGPWYARDVKGRRADDPGAGTCRTSGGHGIGYYGYRGTPETYRAPTAVEHGYRGGFGSTGRGVRA